MTRILLVSQDSKLIDQIKTWSKELSGDPELIIRSALFEKRIATKPSVSLATTNPENLGESAQTHDATAASPSPASSEAFDLVLVDLENKNAHDLQELKADIAHFRKSSEPATGAGSAAKAPAASAPAAAAGALTEENTLLPARIVALVTTETQIESHALREFQFTDMLYKPIERTLYLQKAEIFLAGLKSISFSYLFSQKTEMNADVANDIEITHFSETHLAVVYPIKIKIGVYARIYVDTFNGTDRAWVWARVHHAENHPTKSGYYLISFLLYGLTAKQLFAIRLKLKEERTKHRQPVRFQFPKSKPNEVSSVPLTQMAKAHSIHIESGAEVLRPIHIGIISMDRKSRDEIKNFCLELNTDNTFAEFSNLLSFCKRVQKMKLVPLPPTVTSPAGPNPSSGPPALSVVEPGVFDAQDLPPSLSTASATSNAGSRPEDTDDVLDLESLAESTPGERIDANKQGVETRQNQATTKSDRQVRSRPESGPLVMDESFEFLLRLPSKDLFKFAEESSAGIDQKSRTLFGESLEKYIQDPTKLARAITQLNTEETAEFWHVISQGQRSEIILADAPPAAEPPKNSASPVSPIDPVVHLISAEVDSSLSTQDSPIIRLVIKRVDSRLLSQLNQDDENLEPIDVLFVDVSLLAGEDRENRLHALQDAVKKISDGRVSTVVIGTYEDAIASSSLFSGITTSHASWVDGFRSQVLSGLMSLPIDKRFAREMLMSLIYQPDQFMPTETFESKTQAQIAKVCEIVEISEFGFKLRASRAVRPGVLLHFHADFLKQFDPHGIRIHSISSAAVEGASPGAAAFDSFFIFFAEKDEMQKLIRTWILKEFVSTKTDESA